MFEASKYLWILINPLNVVPLLFGIGIALLWTRWHRFARSGLTILTSGLVLISLFPVGSWLLWSLDYRFPVVTELPDQIDGIIVIGGSINMTKSQARGRISFNANGERLTEFVRLARHYPEAKLVFSGGSGNLRQELNEADFAATFFRDEGIDDSRLIFERLSRNTSENAIFSKKLAKPSESESWLLVTSAFHTPRAVGCFRRIGWRVTAFPVDLKMAAKFPWYGGMDVFGTLKTLSFALHEWLGLIAYSLMDRTDVLFPSPS